VVTNRLNFLRLFMMLILHVLLTVSIYADVQSFEDPDLENCIKDSLGEATTVVTTEKLEAITDLACNGKTISSLKGIEQLKNLKKFEAMWNQIDDLTPLSGLKELQDLSFRGNKITSIEPLKNLPKLSVLGLSNNSIQDLTPLLNHKETLQQIFLTGNNLCDEHIILLSQFKNLQRTCISENNISKVTPFKDLSNLNYIWTGMNCITDYSPIQTLVDSGKVSGINNQGENCACTQSGCDAGFHDENGTCVPNSKTAPCEDNAIANAASIVTDVQILWNGNSWSAPTVCEWSCLENFTLENGVCINQQQVPCEDISPENATSNEETVTISWDSTTGWSTPDQCQWGCDLDFTLEDGVCINSKVVSCLDDPDNPVHSIEDQTDVTINYTTADGWGEIPLCLWSCEENYVLEGDFCINEKETLCSDQSPANADPDLTYVTISYTKAEGWSVPGACEWNCKVDYLLENGVCINQKEVPCKTTETPENATATVSPVTINYTTASGWENTPACNFSCNSGYTNENEACIQTTKMVPCIDQSPELAQSEVINVEIKYENGEWSQPEFCEWSCLEGLELVYGECINERETACIDSAPENATSVIENVTITYSSENGWSDPADCGWSCNVDYDISDGECINEKVVDCTVDPTMSANTSTENNKVTINYTTANGWETPPACVVNCTTDYIVENGDCINEKEAECFDNAPENASSHIQQVTVYYTALTGWGSAGTCNWSCDAGYVHEGQGCINSKEVSCIGNAPANATSVKTNITINYTESGWETIPGCGWNCNQGYNRDGNSCSNDKCKTITCMPNEQCVDDRGDVKCECKDDYVLEAGTCIHTKEAAQNSLTYILPSNSDMSSSFTFLVLLRTSL